MKPVVWLLAGALAATAAFTLYLRSGARLPSGALPDPPVLVDRIQRLHEIVSVRYTVQKVVALEEKKVPLGTERILLFMQADVLAGVDLARLTGADVTVRDGAVRIALGEPRILHLVVDDEQTKVWDRRVTWWTPWVPYDPDFERRARLEARRAIEGAAKDMGILEQARRNAEVAVRALLEAAGIRTVLFEGAS
ncbi:MAG: DUF4230 domain-containing protein [Bryobacterales bacterium]|nr:DUF4230 domain-containing protein [Bryobacterales bacterium]